MACTSEYLEARHTAWVDEVKGKDERASYNEKRRREEKQK
jgi:hypothetical protein